ncbi:MAG: extracellular solute-binding protein [Alphaproteobacteria bacterium]
MTNRIGRALCSVLLVATTAVGRAGSASAQSQIVHVYTTREPGLVVALFEAFEAETGVAVNTVFISQGVAERLIAEGENSPADLIMMVDYGQLINLVDRGLAQPVQSNILNELVPANLRDPANHWFSLSLRARVIYVSAERVDIESLHYEDLANPEWDGRVCVRSGQHAYNTSLFAAYLAKHGEDATTDYLRNLHANLARRAGGGDRDGARDILAGICDLAIGNSYYVGLMRSGAGGADQQEWGAAIRVILPTFEDGLGTHVNISGAAIARYAPHYDNALRLLEFLVSTEAQELYARDNFEYPVRRDVPADPIISALGELIVDPTPLTEISAFRSRASQLVDVVGFDN